MTLSSHHIPKLTQIVDLNLRAKNIKLLEEILEKKTLLWVRQRFLRAQKVKSKN